MAIDAVEFPLNAKRLTPDIEFSTTVLPTFSGNEYRNANRSDSRRRFNAAMGVNTLADAQTLIAFFMAMVGRAVGFLVKDWTDFQTTRLATTLAAGITTQGRATVTATPGVWQMEKWYTVGARAHKRKIKRPKAGAAVYFDGALKNVTTHYTYDVTTGLLTVVSGSPTSIEWTGEFDVPCRFEQDRLPLELTKYALSNSTGVVELPEIPLIEIL